jgi:hypothetical protein
MSHNYPGEIKMEEFGSWYGLLHYLERHNNIVYYKAPMDRYAVMVVIKKVFKNGKVRVTYHDMFFTADSGHLDRFCFKAV